MGVLILWVDISTILIYTQNGQNMEVRQYCNLKRQEGIMNDIKQQKPLTEREKELIRTAIWTKWAPDDRDPGEVIKDTYGGDEEAYLRVMACCHGIPIGIDN